MGSIIGQFRSFKDNFIREVVAFVLTASQYFKNLVQFDPKIFLL